MRRSLLGAGIAAAAAAVIGWLFRRPLVRLGRSAYARTNRNLSGLTKEELYRRAQKADIPGRSEMSKQQLVDALRSTS